MSIRQCPKRLKLAHLSVSSLAHPFGVNQPSAMAASRSVVSDAAPSMVGTAPAQGEAIDQYQWGRGALKLAKMDAQSFEKLANVLGTHAAGEVLLLAIARACGDNVGLWNKAHLVGIPWQRKNWTALSTRTRCRAEKKTAHLGCSSTPRLHRTGARRGKPGLTSTCSNSVGIR